MAGNEHNRPKHALHYCCKAIESDRRGSHTQRISRPLDKRRWTISAVHVMKREINYNLNKCFNDNLSMLGTAWTWLKQVPAVAFETWTWKVSNKKFKKFSNKICKQTRQPKDSDYDMDCAIQMQMDVKTNKSNKFRFSFKNSTDLDVNLWISMETDCHYTN